MVFESVVADLLNRFLGDFVNNLDASQLNIGIWGGDVKLANLEVKETALDDFDLPVKLKFGFLEELVLKIPWKNLYQEPVIACIEGLNLIVVPNKGVVYNESKANKNAHEIKQKALIRLEENRRKKRKIADPAADSFTEKLIGQVIKNLQIKIGKIHVRYEDKYTNRHRPFVAGVTLESLHFNTTDENWKKTIHKDAVQIVYKLISLENLAVYWNPKSELISDLDNNAAILKAMSAAVVIQGKKPDGYKYILEPITMQTKLALNQKPETDGTNWKTPKINLKVDLETLALCVNKFQYQDLLLLLEAQERFQTATRYLKYRPDLNVYHGHSRDWWHFAYKAILEENVRRRRQNWNWERIKKHRKLVKDYKKAWLKKQTEKSLGKDETQIIEQAEKQLDVFNLNIARQQADMEIDRLGLKRMEDQPQGWINWAKSWWGGNGEKDEKKKPHGGDGMKKGTGGDIVSKFEQAMTPEEKAKLFEAIDYQENTPPTDYPKNFIENVISVDLKLLMIVIENAINLKFSHITTKVQQRPSADAVNIMGGIKTVSMDGCGQQMLSMLTDKTDWLSILVDTKPLNRDEVNYDQLVKLSIAPTLLKYHAPAINTAVEALRPPESVRLNQLTSAAMARYEDVKARSVTGLAHAVETKTKLVLDIRIAPTTIIISETGVFNENRPNLITDLGSLTICTVDDEAPDDVSHTGYSENERRAELVKQAYDKFLVKLTNIQLILANDFKTAMDARNDPKSIMHIIRPTGMCISLHKSSIDDLQLPKMKICGELPDIIVSISDERLLLLLKLLLSVPTPEPEKELDVEKKSKMIPAVEFEKRKLRDRAKMHAIMEADEMSESDETSEDSTQNEDKEEKKTDVQQIQLEMNVILNQVALIIRTKDDIYLSAAICRLGCSLQMRTFDMVVNAYLGNICIEQPQFNDFTKTDGQTLRVISGLLAEKENLLQMKFVQANKESPFFVTEYNSTEQAIDINFKSLSVNLHQEALGSLKAYMENLQAKVAEVQQKKVLQLNLTDEVKDQARKLSREISKISLHSITGIQSEPVLKISEARRDRKLEEAQEDVIVKTRLDATFDSLCLNLGKTKLFDTALEISGIRASMKMKVKKMELTAVVQTMSLEDCTNGAMHKRLLAICGQQEMFSLNFYQFNRSTAEKEKMGPSDLDMSVKCRFAQIRFVFLNLWLSRQLKWIEPFQAEAARAASHAQAIAAEKASEAAQNVKQIMMESPPRIHLDIEMAAPTIVVPNHSQSLDALVFDLGKLAVINSFSTIKQEPKAVIDAMQISLTNICFGIGLIKQNESIVQSECQILKPITFSLSVFKNLSFKWYKDTPEIVVNAHLPSITINMSEEDYQKIMRTLTGNLAEGGDSSSKHAVAPAKIEAEKKKDTEDQKASVKAGVTSSETLQFDKTAKRFVFGFKLDEIAIGLYTGSTNLENSHGSITHSSASGFAVLNLKNLKISGAMTEDGAMDIALSLAIFTMDDERIGATRITRLLDKKPDKNGKYNEQFIGLRFQQNATNDKIKFLGSLASFFTVTQTQEEAARAKEEIVVAIPAHAKPSRTAAETSPSGTIAMNCKMREVEIILIEDSNCPESTQALILSFNCELVAKHELNKQFMDGGVKNLQIISSYYAEEKRHYNLYQVLSKVDIDVKGSINTSKKSQDFALTVGSMHLKISPSIIRLLSAVGASFSEANKSKEVKLQTKRPVLKKYPNYWLPRKTDKSKYWWFNVVEAPEEELEQAVDVVAEMDHQEKAVMKMESLIVTLEAGVGDRTSPMILVECSLNAVAKQWSSLMMVDGDLSLQISYYNESFCVWEPVIEPNEVDEDVYQTWILRAQVRTHGEDEMEPTDGSLPPSRQTVMVKANEMLNITITKSFLQLLNKLSDSFEKAAKQITPPRGHEFPGTAQYLILNNTGVSCKVVNSENMIVNQDGTPVDATPCTFVDLDIPVDPNERIGLSQSIMKKKALLRIYFDQLETEREVNVLRAESRTMALPYKGDDGHQWKIVAETKVENLRRLVYLHSTVQFMNHMDGPFEVHSMRDTMLEFCGIVQPSGELFDVALPVLHTPTGELFLKPMKDGYEISNESLCWNKFEDKMRYVVRCNMSEDEAQGLFVAQIIEEVPLKAERSKDYDDRSFIVHIYPPLTIHNFLPVQLEIISPMQCVLSGGEESPLNIIPGQKVGLKLEYRGDKYVAEMDFPVERQDLMVVTFISESKILNVGVHWSTQYRRLDAEIYAPYWFVNNTGRKIFFSESDTGALTRAASCVPCQKGGNEAQYDDAMVQEPFSEPAFLPLGPKDFLSKKKARLSLTGLHWSDEFPLDAVGNAGCVSCKDESDQELSIRMEVSMCQSGLTKIITFMPFYLLHNQSSFAMEAREHGTENWTLVEPESCVGFWPHLLKSKRRLVTVRYAGTTEETIQFPFTESFEGLCKINNAHLGIYVTCSFDESSAVIRLDSFEPGMAPTLIINECGLPVQYRQKGINSWSKVDLGESCAFTWVEITHDRQLEWRVGDVTGCDGLFKNAFDSFKARKTDENQTHWVSFLNGRQRILLFTNDLAIVTTAHAAYEVERAERTIEMSMQGIGFSLVDNIKAEEIAYMGIASSAIIWEQLVKSRYKLFSIKQIEEIEAAYQEWLQCKSDEAVTVEKLDIDFKRMILKKKRSEIPIRRQFQMGLWLLYRQTPRQTHIHFKLNHLQVDNQLNSCVFPCVLTVVPPPRSIVQDNAPKPFTEFSYIMCKSEHSTLVQIKYLHLLIQEFSVQVDQGFLNAVLELFTNEMDSKPYSEDMFKKDLEMTKNQLAQLASTTTAQRQKAFYEDLHISPLMMHLSFSQGGSSGRNDKFRTKSKKVREKEAAAAPPIQSEFVNVFLKSVGVTLTEIQDVVFKLAFFERKFAFYDRQQLQNEIISHYTSQVIKQLYVLVLGLDILGNPFGLMRDLSSGVEDLFYQPFQGAVQGPEEFAEGVALGVKGLFGATVGGGAGAASRITGTVGKGIAALTLDQEYQRKRQQALSKRPQSVGEGIARGAKGFGVGIVDGITGVVSKPLEGARTGGALGFAKGLGLGLVGVVARPVSGAVDFASNSLDAVKMVATGAEDVKPLRPARVIFSDNIVRPYCQKLALGAKIFRDADHGEVSETDYFVAHAPISERSIFIVTNRRALLVRKGDIVATWGTEWQIPYTDMRKPELFEKGVKLELKRKYRGFAGIGASSGKVIEFYDQTVADEIGSRLLSAYELEIEG